MRLFSPRATVLFAAIAVLALAGGCHAASRSSGASAQPASARAPAVSQQLIIKFRRAAVPCDRSGVAAFAQASGVALELVRPMSGEACVILQSGASTAELARGLDALRKHAAVEWAEPDAIMKTQ